MRPTAILPRQHLSEGVALVAFVLSGATGLIAEVCWIRRASLVFGSTTFALSTVLGVFFLGLALGSAAFGWVSIRLTAPLRIYAWLELLLAILVPLTLPVFVTSEDLYRAAVQRWGGQPLPLFFARLTLVACIVLPPSFCMGGTLPLLCQHFVRQLDRIATPIGLLYALNTLGAAAGCSATGLWLIPGLGVTRSLLLAAALDLILGIVVLLVSPPMAATRPVRRLRVAEEGVVTKQRPIAVPLLFLVAGFAALGYEVLWTRFLALVVRNTVLTYTITLTVVLLGIVLGSLLASRLADRTRHRIALFGAFQVAQALIVWGMFHFPAVWWWALGERVGTYLVLLLPASILSGAAFPLAMRLVLEAPGHAGPSVGRMTALNTIGGIAGSLCVGFLLLPHWGLTRSAQVLTSLNLGAGITAWLLLGERRSLGIATAVLVVTCWALIPRVSGTRVPQDFLAPGEDLVDSAEGLESNLAIIQRQSALVLEMDRWWQGQNTPTHQIVAAHLPMLLHPAPRRVLVVGVGAGQTPSRFLMYDDITHLDCVDIEPQVFDLLRKHFDSTWMQDPRVQLLHADGRNLLTYASSLYDVISLEVGQLFRPGVATFYTQDFYLRARARLRPGGILSQFVPLGFLSTEEFASILATFLSVFPNSVLWYNTGELLLLGIQEDEVRLDCERLQHLLSAGPIHDDLRFAYWGGEAEWLNHPAAFLAGYLAGPERLAALAVPGRVYRDDRPVLEYATRRVIKSETREFETLPLLQASMSPLDGSILACLPDSLWQRAKELRQLNIGDLAASALLRRVEVATAEGNLPEVERLLQWALQANPRNVTALRLMGDTLLLQGHAERAVSFLERALAIRSEDALAARGLGFAKQRLGDLDAAIEFYRMALRASPEDAEAHNLLGVALVNQGRLDEAVQHFSEAVRLRPGDVEAAENLRRTRDAMQAR